MQQHGLTLAVHILTTHFGDPVGEVGRCLLQKGSLTLQELVHFTKFDLPMLKNCLLVLTQHNCVQAFSAQKSGKFVTHYMALFNNIIHRMRFPKFLAIVTECLDKVCEDLYEGILQHGRLTLEQVISRAMSKPTEGNADSIRANFVRLVNAHFLVRCPKAEPSLETPEIDPTAKRAKTAGITETLEQRALAAAAPLDAEKFFVVVNTGDKWSSETNGTTSSEFTVGGKRKHEALDIDNETRASIFEKEVLWCPNFVEFIRRLRHKACVENVRLRLDTGAATLLEAVLKATRSLEAKVKEEKSVPLSLNAILQELRARPYPQLTTEQVLNALKRLGCEACEGEEEKLFSIDLKNIIQVAQIAEVESLVKRRYGEDAHRIFRFLSKSRSLVETSRISDQIIIDKKEALKNLCLLFKDGYLHMEKVGAREDLLLWKVTPTIVWEHILNDMYHAALNLSQRIAHELKQDHEILTLPQLNEVQKKRLERVFKVKNVLEASLLQLDDAIMLFHEF